MSFSNDPTSVSEARLKVVQGYNELGMGDEAWEELQDIERCFPATPSIVQMKLLLHINDENWGDALGLSEELRLMEPHGGAGYIHGAYCLHELERTNEAVSLLERAPEEVREDAIYHYNKGCYQAALGDVETARHCLEHSFAMDGRLLEVARKDPDLRDLRESLEA